MFIYQKRLDMKIFLHPTKVSKKTGNKKGVNDSNWIYWSILKGAIFDWWGGNPDMSSIFPASRSKDQPGPFVEFIPGIVWKFFGRFEKKKQPKCWQGNSTPQNNSHGFFGILRGFFVSTFRGLGVSWLVETWGPRSNGSETASLRLTKPRSSPGVKTHEKPGIFFSLAKCGTGPLLILKMGMLFQREHKGFLLACALKIFEVGLESVVLYSMAGDTVRRKKSKALEGPVVVSFMKRTPPFFSPWSSQLLSPSSLYYILMMEEIQHPLRFRKSCE